MLVLRCVRHRELANIRLQGRSLSMQREKGMALLVQEVFKERFSQWHQRPFLQTRRRLSARCNVVLFVANTTAGNGAMVIYRCETLVPKKKAIRRQENVSQPQRQNNNNRKRFPIVFLNITPATLRAIRGKYWRKAKWSSSQKPNKDIITIR